MTTLVDEGLELLSEEDAMALLRSGVAARRRRPRGVDEPTRRSRSSSASMNGRAPPRSSGQPRRRTSAAPGSISCTRGTFRFAPGLAAASTTRTHEAGARLLEELKTNKVLDDLDVHTHLVEGSPAAAILDVARSCSLVVVDSRGRNRLSGTLLGSTSRQVLHHAPCPVVVAPPEF